MSHTKVNWPCMRSKASVLQFLEPWIEVYASRAMKGLHTCKSIDTSKEEIFLSREDLATKIAVLENKNEENNVK